MGCKSLNLKHKEAMELSLSKAAGEHKVPSDTTFTSSSELKTREPYFQLFQQAHLLHCHSGLGEWSLQRFCRRNPGSGCVW